MKTCGKCQQQKNTKSFYKNKSRKDGLSQYCKCCEKKHHKNKYKKFSEEIKLRSKAYHEKNKQNNQLKARKRSQKHYQENKKYYLAKDNQRKAMKLQRTPAWADLEAIKEVYRNCPKGYHVDHIIPLRGKEVSGLHIAENLQYLTPEENLTKSNKLLESERSL